MKRTQTKKNTTGKAIIIGIAAIAVLAGTALAASYATRQSMTPEKAPVQQARTVTTKQNMAMNGTQPVRQAQPPCDDNNIVGTLAGGAAGGLIGSRFGSGNGKTVATVGGALGGAALGNHYIPTRGATCN